MNNRPTPETDALIYRTRAGISMFDHARKMERERDEAKELAQAFHNDQVTLLLERDEAREKYDIEATEHMLAVNKLCGERDKAREDATNYYAKIGELEDERDRLQAELEENYIISGRSANREWKLITELNQAKKLAADWEECANQFFFCAGRNKTASWEQFEKAATTYQFLKKKGAEC